MKKQFNKETIKVFLFSNNIIPRLKITKTANCLILVIFQHKTTIQLHSILFDITSIVICIYSISNAPTTLAHRDEPTVPIGIYSKYTITIMAKHLSNVAGAPLSLSLCSSSGNTARVSPRLLGCDPLNVPP